VELHARVLKRISLCAILPLKQTLRRALEVQCAYRYFSRTLDRLNASHHHPDIA
jgi:hypothetical protein